ncbi:possible HAMP domain [Synechococcus sp. RS9916]|nr:possible HAMP domain [Synechococcus sp. RS9916]
MTLQPESLSKAIQLSVAPVFLLAGIGALMNVLYGRLVRIVDTAKQLRATREVTGSMDERTRRIYRQRMQLTMRAIALLTATTLLISAVVAAMFLSVVFQLNLTAVVVPLFISAMVLLMLASLCFLREVQLAAKLLQNLI